MRIGLSTYASFWQHSARASAPLGVSDMVRNAAEFGSTVFQICDYPLIESFDAQQLDALATEAAELGVDLELGTRGIHAPQLDLYLSIAERLGARVVRSMAATGPATTATQLAASVARYERAGVTLALETYEQLPTDALLALIDEVDHPHLGVCLDPANMVAALENPRQVIDAVAGRVLNVHVKDFRFTRHDGLVGFSLTGCELGTGQLDMGYLVDRMGLIDSPLSAIVEHWLPWQGDERSTLDLERSWTAAAVAYLQHINRLTNFSDLTTVDTTKEH